MGRERVLRLEPGKDAKGVDTFAYASANRQVHLAQAQHLGRVNQPEISGGTGCANGVRRSGDAEIERGLARGVVRDGPRIVVVRPELGIVVELRNRVDFVLRLDVAVLGAPHVNAGAILGQGLKVYPAVRQRLAGAINADASSPRADPDLLLLLVFQGIIVADPGEL